MSSGNRRDAFSRPVRYVIAALLVFSILGMGFSSYGPAQQASAAVPSAQSRATLPSTSIVISEFRTRGPVGGNDEFVELYNLSNTPVDVSLWRVNGSNAGGSVTTRAILPAGTIIQPGCYYLVTHGGYTGTVPGDFPYTLGISDDGGIALLDSTGAIVDQVGMSAGSAYGEGSRLSPLTVSQEQSYERLPGFPQGNWTDTDDNASNFRFNSGVSYPQNRFSGCIAAGGTPTSVASTSTSTALASTSTSTALAATSTGTNTAAPATATPAVATNIIINELDSDQAGTDAAEFVELYDGGVGNTSLTGLVVVFYNGNGDTSYASYDLDGYLTNAQGYFTLGNAAVPGVDLIFPGNFLQNGQDAVAIYVGDASQFPNGTPVTTSNLLDAIVYGTDDPTDPELQVLLNSGQPQVNESGAGDPTTVSVQRCPNGSGGQRNTSTYFPFAPTSDSANICSGGATGTATTTAVVTPSSTQTPGGATATTTATAGPSVRIREIQSATHRSPLLGQAVSNVPGVVFALRTNGFFMQDPAPDANESTSEGIFVFTSSNPSGVVQVGHSVLVSGTVSEFRPGGGGGTTNLSITQITASLGSISVVSTGNPTPTPVIVGTGGRIPPTEIIEDQNCGDVELGGCAFDPATDGLDFYESLEGMLSQVNNAVAVGPTNDFGEIPVLGDNGANASVRTTRGGIVIRPNDFNPERIILDDVISTSPDVKVGDTFSQPILGVFDYSFGNFKFLHLQAPSVVPTVLPRETTRPQVTNELAIANFNVENLDPGDPPSKFQALAQLIVNNMKSPDLLSIEEVQDNDGPTNSTVVDADVTYNTLITAIQNAGGPTYQYRQVNPVDDQDGGEPGGNIRQGFLFRTDRGLQFVDRPGGCSTCDTQVVSGPNGPELSFSPGRVRPTATAFANSRKPLAGEFMYNGHKLFVVGNHLNSKGGDQPIFGRFQQPQRSSEVQRHQQAQIINDFVDQILALDANAKIVVLGDINDFYFSTTVNILEGDAAGGSPAGVEASRADIGAIVTYAVASIVQPVAGSAAPAGAVALLNLIETLPLPERYTYVFDGNSQDLDNTLVSQSLFNNPGREFDVVHVNSEYPDQISDHDPQVSRFLLPVGATPTSTPSTPTAMSTSTAIPTSTSIPTTAIPTITGTNTALPSPTNTRTITALPSATGTNTAVPTASTTVTAVPTLTLTPLLPTLTRTVAVPTLTPAGTATTTRTASAVASPTGTVCAVQLLLIPDWTNDRVMAFNPVTGDLVNADFIPSDPTNLSSPKNAILSAAGNTILVSDQIDDVVQEYAMNGTFIRTFAPAGGRNPAILDNILGITLRPNGNLLVTVTGGGNVDSVAEFDTSGNYLGTFIDPGAGGLDSPFDILYRTTITGSDYLVPAINSDAVHKYDVDGNPQGIFTAVNSFPEQIALGRVPGNVLVANFSGTETGILEYTTNGVLVGRYTAVTGNRGVYELPNGNFLTTAGNEVVEVNRLNQIISTKLTGVSGQYIELVTVTQPGPCLTPTVGPSTTPTAAVPTATRTVTALPTTTRTVTALPTLTVALPTLTVTRTPSVIPTITSVVPTVTAQPTGTGTAASTSTVPPSATRTATVAPSVTGTAVATGTAAATQTRAATGTASATATVCTIQFSDVPTTYTFYTNIRCLACRGIIGGYADGTFRPENLINRGQIAKMVSNAAGYSEPVTGQTYTDVPPTDTFYTFIERLSQRGHMGGYPCGGVNPQRGTAEPCDPVSRPYFRTYNNATRGQVTKIVSNAAGFNEPVPAGQQTFTDVPVNSAFWVYIERLYARGIVSGVDCGGVNPETGQAEPCDSESRPYFRPNNSIKRGQTSKIVSNTFYPECGGRAVR